MRKLNLAVALMTSQRPKGRTLKDADVFRLRMDVVRTILPLPKVLDFLDVPVTHMNMAVVQMEKL